MPKYIYESPDGGKTVYRRLIGVPHAERELCSTSEDRIDITITDDGVVHIIE